MEDSVKNAIANVRLEDRQVSREVLELLDSGVSLEKIIKVIEDNKCTSK